jgi:hypothetical protein
MGSALARRTSPSRRQGASFGLQLGKRRRGREPREQGNWPPVIVRGSSPQAPDERISKDATAGTEQAIVDRQAQR